MSEPFIGQIALFAFNFPPKGWGLCNGQLLPINQNQALFSLLGTTFGGNGQTTFALPDLRGRVPAGVGIGGANPVLGESAGAEAVTLTVAQLPAHTHALNTTKLTATVRAANSGGNQPTAVGNTFAIVNPGSTQAYSSTPDGDMQASSAAFGGAAPTQDTGSSQPHENRQPYLVLSYCIALIGIFPSQP
jgi:microcystin-dependent protein